MLLRLLPDPAGLDRCALAEAIFGPAFTAEQRDLISAALRKLAEHPHAGADETEADGATGADDGDEAGSRDESAGWESAFCNTSRAGPCFTTRRGTTYS